MEYKDSYIPVFWTENQISRYNARKLQDLVQALPEKLRFTVVQHDDGIFTKLKNVVIFGMGGVGTIPLPLTYENPELFSQYKHVPKTTFCSFVGSLTHPCRLQSIRQLHNKPNVVLKVSPWTNVIAEEKQKEFLEITSKSRFTLAPRGYGKSSFRMYEALNLGSIPVYVYDDPWLPYTELIDWRKMAVLVHVQEIPTLYEKLLNISDLKIQEMLSYYELHKHLFTYKGMSEYILDKFSKIKIDLQVHA